MKSWCTTWRFNTAALVTAAALLQQHSEAGGGSGGKCRLQGSSGRGSGAGCTRGSKVCVGEVAQYWCRLLWQAPQGTQRV